jgi:hypothetical protein
MSPDTMNNVYFSRILAKTHSLEYCESLSNKYSTNIFGSRGFKITKDNCLSHGSMHGFIYILAVIQAVSDKLLFIVVPVFSLLTLIYFFKLNNLLSGAKSSILAVILLFCSPSFLFYSNALMNNIPALFALTAYIFYLVRGIKSSSWKDMSLSHFFIGTMIFIRYESVLFLAPEACVILSLIIRKKLGFRLSKYLISLTFLIVFLVALAVINVSLYGGVFKFKGSPGTQLASVLYYNQTVDTQKLLPFLPSFSLEVLSNNLLRFLVIYNPVILIFFITKLIKLFAKKQIYQSVNIVLLGIFLLPICFYLSSVWGGYFEKNTILGTSYVRYLLPSYAVMLIFAAKDIYQHSQKLLIAFICVVFGVTFTISSNGGLSEFVTSQQNYLSKKQYFVNFIPEGNAIVFTTYSDKYFFPERKTAIYTTFDEINRINSTDKIIHKLLQDNIPVYFVIEDWAYGYDIYKSEDYFQKFRSSGLILNEVSQSIIKVTN